MPALCVSKLARVTPQKRFGHAKLVYIHSNKLGVDEVSQSPCEAHLLQFNLDQTEKEKSPSTLPSDY